ncbi:MULTISPECIES: siderophore ABC transporter substrate-binding protein [unclassified Salinivibrio]|uniref:siderophore ABC transporter substrate-binding protein n=1 Tax=unclassified Salinivibrio TaxID=2636825 RepID=UPI0009884423|nr:MULTISPECIES: ABC transporter substrate-binding protein [unclassified Salinivibrio]MPS30893.1 ferric anguibactin-binding protein [Salinivibrio sp. VYel7]MPX89566.1 ferric anguibactin-binding protein [Salinivibrio sp. VYel1]MPX92294.1 ferric anguibactin-binding protein [Salinivibrio sp. VYel9]MPX97130.1 ferric anguibactin-binding protein [Salinivibrio sp. VYel6]MPX98526.1 ferric anguibactin-binding protein [Salinivibrio sp. VYel4]
MQAFRSFFPFIFLTVSLLLSSQAAAKTITHAMGTVEIDGVPQRVVVLGQGSLDVLDRLGVEPVGVVKSLMPDYLAKTYQDDKYVAVGTVKEPDYEAIFTAKPDLIIAEARMASLMGELEEIAPTIMFRADYENYWQSVQANWRMLGEVFNKQEKVDAIIEQMNTKIAQTHDKAVADNFNALMVMSNGSKVAMFGENSRFGMVFDELGLKPAKSDDVEVAGSHGNLISFEYIADANPDVLLVLDREQAIGEGEGKAKARFDNPLVNKTHAHQQQRISYLDPTAWYITMAGMTAMDKMIDDVNRVL